MNFPHMIYGGDYNPDQWPEETWLEDAHLMQEAGVNLVSLGIFSWTKLEPQPGVFEFAWLDKLMDLLHAHGVSVNLATPTASPPAWMVRLHPEMLPVTNESITLWHGSRRHYCPHNPDYRNYARRIAAKLAERYKEHPALAMWHVDNEYGGHVGECFCDISAAAFRAWLMERYVTLDKLNFVWGTAFWSQIYSDWDEILPPRRSPAHVNPAQQLDWARFSSDSWLVCFEEQKAALKAITPHIPVTTNFMGFHKGVDYFKFAAHEDVVSQDSYPDTYDSDWAARAGIICDLVRSVGARQPWILMEQAASQVNWRQRNAVKRPGVMRLGSYQAIARGADGVMFFQWRQSRAGSEKHHSGMVPHAGTDSRVWREVKSLGEELHKLDEILSSQVKAEVAILMDWENWWALELSDKPSNDLRLLPQLTTYYTPLFKRNITVDFAHPESDLSGYKLVLVPNLYLVNDRSATNINRYVENGGTLVMGFFSGIVDENEHIHSGGYPAPFRDMLGCTVEEYVPYSETQLNMFCTIDGKQFQCSFWSDVIRLKSSQAVATYEQDYYAGSAAITRNRFGNGTAFYVGTIPDPNGMDWLLDHVCRTANVQPVAANAPAGVELLQRTKETSTWLFGLNYSSEKVTIPFEGSGQELLTGRQINGSIEIEPAGVAIVKLE
ncbi:MAG TPA: beta-galactosidase [Anaerolineales bacterium]|nr:beta-galactosidase [Anaerolineales bacterium]